MIVTLSLQSQIVGSKVLDRPSKYLTPEGYDDLMPANGEVITGQPWIVYVDQVGVSSYKKASNSTVFKDRLTFLDEFMVVGETNDYLHIIKDDNLNSINQTVSSSGVDYGWVNKNKLLLSQACLVTIRGKVPRKAMMLNTVSSFKERQVRRTLDSKVEFWSDPEMTKLTNNFSSLFEVYFVYKIAEKSVLIGRSETIGAGYKPSEVIKGWVPRSRTVFWNHRIAIEPNGDEDAVKERQSKGINAQVLKTENEALQFRKLKSNNDEHFFSSDDDFMLENGRMIGDWRRFPLYDKNNNFPGIFKVGVMGNIVSDAQVMSALKKAEIDKMNSDLTESVRNLNIVFVIDGTASMGPYYKPISNSIKKVMSNLQDNFGNMKTLNKLKFGAIIYRDFAEGDRMIVKIPLNANYNEISRKLNQIEARGWNDRDAPEAVFKGIEKGIRLFNNPYETNVIVLIGDAGNHHRSDESQVSELELINKLSSYQTHFLIFQVSRVKDHKTYDEFIPQNQNLIESAAIERTKQIQVVDSKKLLKNKVPTFVSCGVNRDSLIGSFNVATMVYPSKGNKIQSYVLESEIPKFIQGVDNFTNAYLHYMDEIMVQGVGVDEVMEKNKGNVFDNRTASDFGSAIVNYLATSGISVNDIKAMMENKTQMFTTGYVTLELSNLKLPLFEKVVLLSRGDLGDLISSIKKLARAKGNQRRQRMRDTWIELLQENIGEIDVEEMMDKGMSEITKILFDVPSQSEFLNKIRLRDITDPRMLSNQDFEELVFQFQRKQIKLSNIFNNDDYKEQFRSLGIPYFWIPEYLMP